MIQKKQINCESLYPAFVGTILNKLAKAKGLKLGIFMALHTFGRTLNWRVHLHVSVTQGGLTNDHQWKSLFSKKNTLMVMWRYALITFLRTQHQQGALTRAPEMGNQNMGLMLTQQYAKYWQVHCAKPHKNPKKDIEYLGRYIKRPAIANSRLVHYNGTSLLFKFLNHRTKQTQYTELHPLDFITRFIQHLPEKGFRLIRYFGFLANRLRTQLLPIVSSLLTISPIQNNALGLCESNTNQGTIHSIASYVNRTWGCLSCSLNSHPDSS